MRLHVVTIALTLVTVWALPARAADGQSALSVSLSYATYTLSEQSPNGGVVGLEYERGFSDALSWRVSAGGGGYLDAGQLSYSGHLVGGLTYLFDVLKYVPYAKVGVGGIVIADSVAGTTVKPLVEIGVGLDVLASRSFSYGVQVGFESFLQHSSFFTAGARVTWRWGFF